MEVGVAKEQNEIAQDFQGRAWKSKTLPTPIMKSDGHSVKCSCTVLASGFLKHFCDLDDATKYAGINFFLQFNQPPTNDTFTRAAKYPNFCLHTGAPWESLEPSEDREQV